MSGRGGFAALPCAETEDGQSKHANAIAAQIATAIVRRNRLT